MRANGGIKWCSGLYIIYIGIQLTIFCIDIYIAFRSRQIFLHKLMWHRLGSVNIHSTRIHSTTCYQRERLLTNSEILQVNGYYFARFMGMCSCKFRFFYYICSTKQYYKMVKMFHISTYKFMDNSPRIGGGIFRLYIR